MSIKKTGTLLSATLGLLMAALPAQATVGYADVVLDYYNSGAYSPFSTGSFGGTVTSHPVIVSTSVALDAPDGTFLSLPTGSFVTLGFTDETVVDGVGGDIFVKEIGSGGESANVYVSADTVNFVFLGVANNSSTTTFDLNDISFTGAVQAIKIVGNDAGGSSPGFDLDSVQVLPGSIGAPVPAPASIIIFALGCGLLGFQRKTST